MDFPRRGLHSLGSRRQGQPAPGVGAVDAVSVDVESGMTLALVGESGCGKSMTALSIMRLLPEAGHIVSGTVRINGEDVLALSESAMRHVRGTRIAMIFQ